MSKILTGIIVVALLVVAVLIVLQLTNPAIGSIFPGINIDFSNMFGSLFNPPNVTPSEGSSVDLCHTFTTYYPTYIAGRSADCITAGGAWVCDDDRMGCYMIPSWNSTLCTSAESQALKAICFNFAGDWTCHSSEISCEV